MSSRDNFIAALKQLGMKQSSSELESHISENLISPYVIELPTLIKEQAKELIAGLYDLRSSPDYLKFYAEELKQKNLIDPGNKAIAMSYDVHWDQQTQKIKLIEVNTNAAFLFLSEALYMAAGLSQPIKGFHIKNLIQCCENEILLSKEKKSRTLNSTRRIAVIDENPEQQKLFIEFLFTQHFLQFHGWDCEILDFRKIDLKKFDLVYNRFTDFYFNSPESQDLRSAFLNGTTTFSPNPFEYFLLADKQRMIDWHQPQFMNFSEEFKKYQKVISDYVPRADLFSTIDLDTLWSERKKYFFKPKSSFGSKLSYKGASISRKFFDGLPREEMIRQEFIPAPEVTFTEGQTFKYDLRLYAYQGELQSVIARIYQGQVTNLQTKNGGFACVKWI